MVNQQIISLLNDSLRYSYNLILYTTLYVIHICLNEIFSNDLHLVIHFIIMINILMNLLNESILPVIRFL